MTARTVAVIALLLLVVTAPASAQGTYTGTATPGAQQYYSFTPLESGPFTATLSWDNGGSNLLLILVCGTSDPIAFGAAAGRMDRSARIESGLIGLNPCLLGVSTDIVAAYRLHLQHATGQVASPRLATESRAGAVDTRLREYADQTLAALQARMR